MARRRNSSRRRRRGSFGFLYKLLCVLAICVVLVVALTMFFRVGDVVVSGQQRYTEEEIRTAAGIEEGDNLILLNKHEIAQRIVSALPYVEQTSFHRKLPDTLYITIEECGNPVALVQEGVTWLISPKGKIVDQLSTSSPQGYPLVDGCKLLAPSVGTKIALESQYAQKEESLKALLAALEEAQVMEQVDAIHLDDASVIAMDYMGRFRVEMAYGADYAYKLKTLAAILESGKIQENMTGTFDMHREDGKTNFIQNRE